MKPPLCPSLFAWLVAVLLLPAAAMRAADDAPAPDYPAVIKALFQKADVVKITGHVVEGIRHNIECIETEAAFRKELEDLFLAEKPRYLGRDIPPHLGEYFSSRLNFTWVDVEQKELGHAALLEGDRLLINDSLLFSLSPMTGEKNLTFLRHAAMFANDLVFDTPADTPNFRRMVSGFFAKAASCKITGYHNMSREGPHMIDYTTPDLAGLLELKRIFLHEKAVFSYEVPAAEAPTPDQDLSNGNSVYKFTWLDAQGAPLASAALVDRHLIGLNGRLYFAPHSAGRSGTNITLWLSITRLVDPGIFTPPPSDYQAMIQDLFSKAASCSIEGSYAIGKILPYDVNFTASDSAALLALKEIFLFEKPRYKERSNGDPTHITRPSRLHFIWKDAQGKELGGVSLINEDRLEFTPTHDIFQITHFPGSVQRNITLLTHAARFALPRSFKRPAKPDYQDLVQGLFLKAATCRIKGYHTDVETDTTHDVDIAASDPAALLALKKIFLTEKTGYLGICSNDEAPGPFDITSLHCIWTDAQGKEVGHVALLNDDHLLFAGTQDLFATGAGAAGSGGTTLVKRLAHFEHEQPRPPAPAK
ncbi:hypothetical protein [Prosthecobacter sp.]|uniref:hypothetical protein n=1 Tax=Prosthecobacter sp. TaxID=1965333 RepID=UPI003782F784